MKDHTLCSDYIEYRIYISHFIISVTMEQNQQQQQKKTLEEIKFYPQPVLWAIISKGKKMGLE